MNRDILSKIDKKMALNSNIQWCDHSWNPWHGCKKFSEGCKYCYMYRDKERYGHDPTTVLRSKSTFNDPIKWAFENRAGVLPHDMKGDAFPGMKIFTCSWSDFFIEEADQWRAEAWSIIRQTPEFTYQILTKRPHRILECLPPDWGNGYPNVWLGVSCENQARYWERMPQLARIPAALRFLSLEPLLGKIEMEENDSDLEAIGWVIVGGESGNETGKYTYRICQQDWVESICISCLSLGIPVFVKQLGTFLAKDMKLKSRHGQAIGEWPVILQRQEFPA